MSCVSFIRSLVSDDQNCAQYSMYISSFWSHKNRIFLAFDFCRFYVVIRFFHPRHNGQWPPTSKDFYPRFYPLHLIFYPNSWKKSVFPFLMFSAKQWHYWYHFYNVFGITRSLTGDWTRDLPKPSCSTFVFEKQQLYILLSLFKLHMRVLQKRKYMLQFILVTFIITNHGLITSI